MTDTTLDKFLDGRLLIEQPKRGYRAGVDPVFLAAAIEAKPGQAVLELGTGVGTALLCLMSRVQGLQATGVERDEVMAALARCNAKRNRHAISVHTESIGDLPTEVSQNVFDHVFANPPYFPRSRGSSAKDASREGGRGEVTPLSIWVDVATRRTKPGGTVTFIQRANRLPELFGAIDGRLGGLVVQPLAPRIGRNAELALVHARKGSKAEFVLKSPIYLHQGAQHERDGDDYSEVTRKVLRDGLSWRNALLTES